jgi:hypothetical protein
MQTYQNASIPASVGYEIGTPAYPDPVEDTSNQLPLTQDEFSSIISTTQPKVQGGFFWAIFKPANNSQEVTPTQVAQTVCKTVNPSSPRCTGTLPPPSPAK